MKKELKAIIRNKKLLISLIAVLFLPMIYAGVFASSMWDPYGRLDKVPVAIVNEDNGVTNEGKDINIGNSLVEKLKESNDFEWHFVSKEDANQGIDNSKYYMTMYIDKDFSERSLKIATETIPIEFKVNPGRNFSGAMITTSAANTISNNLNKEITEKYMTVIAENLDNLKEKLGEAADGTNKLVDGSNKFGEGLNSLSSGIGTLNNGQSVMLNKINDVSKQYEKINSGLATANDKFSELKAGQNTLGSGLNDLANGGHQLVTNGALLQNGISELNSGINTLDSTLKSSVAKANSPENVTKLNQLKDGSAQVQDALNKLSAGADNLNSGLSELANRLPSKEQIENLKTTLSNLGLSTPTNLNNLDISINQIEVANQTLAASLSNNEVFANLTAEEQQSILQTVYNTNTAILKNTLTTIKTTIDNNIAGMGTSLQDKKGELLNLVGGLEQMHNALDQGLVPGANSINNGLQQLASNYNQINIGTNQLIYTTINNQKSIMDLAAGVDKIANGSSTLNNKYSEYLVGINKVNNGLGKAVDGNNKLINGSTLMQQGLNDLANGSSTFNNQFFPQVSDGLTQLIDGSNKLLSGTNQLSNGNTQMKDGLTSLNNGLEKGVDTLQKNNLAQKVKFISKPTETNKIAVDDITAYGNIFVAYLIPLGLYISSIAFNFVYPMSAATDYTENRGKYWYRSKLFIMTLQAIFQALLTGVLMRHLLKIDVEKPLHFYIMLLIISMAYMTFITLLTITMGNVGRFLAIVFLVLQLGSAGGTFPIETSSAFYIALNKILPMTRALQGLQHSIAGGMNSYFNNALIYLGIMIIICSILLKLYYLYHDKNRKLYAKLLNK